MRKALISLVIVALMLTFPTTFNQIDVTNQISQSSLDNNPVAVNTLSSAGDTGVLLPTTQFMSRSLNSRQIDILNSYSNTGVHSGDIDLTEYLVPGWHIYNVEMDVSNFEAAPERETLGVTYENAFFYIQKIGVINYTELSQGFYNQPFDGVLQNYSIYYSTDDYTPSTRGNASTIIASDYTTASAITAPVNITDHDTAFSWEIIPGQSAALDASSTYWVVINGSLMKEAGSPTPTFPKIWWGAEDDGGSFDSYMRLNGVWQSATLEPLFNYTYIPWNRTSNTALQFLNPESLSLQANSSAMTGLSWKFTNNLTNITSIDFDTNQSVYLDYDITIWYKKADTSSTNWFSETPASNIEWNATTSVTYPSVSGTLNRFLNFTVQLDWIPSDLYNGSTPIVGTNTKYGTTVHCASMTNGTWILSSSAPNYVGNIALTGATDDKVSILTDLDIDATIEDGNSTPITGGTTNLTVLQTGISVHSVEIPATGGSAGFVWDINSTTSGNGTHSIEVFWTNGTEAGYSVTQVFVYYPTTLVADEYAVNAYAENTFVIGIDFNDIGIIRGLEDSLADVEYSFDGGVNTSLDDQTGGRWTATISTVGKLNGTYMLYVYAEGYALENQSLAITVNLIYETLPLVSSWSNTDNITYTESTNLTITYLMEDGITKISGATVNVTIEGVPHNMTWDALTETYWIELTGENFTGVGTFPLDVIAWKAGYEAQNNNSIMIIIRSETGLVFDADYNPTTLNISFIETIFIQVTYEFNSVPIQSNTWVRVLFNGSPTVNLDYNATSMKWEVTLQGDDYFGDWDIIVRASADGYTTLQNSTTFIVYADTPNLSNSWVGSAATTDYATAAPFNITLTMSNGTPINDATVSFTAFSTLFTPTSISDGVYTFSITPNATRGVESFTVTVVRTGYVTTQMDLDLTVEATTSLTLSHNIQEWEEWNITIEATYLDTVYGPIAGATVNITLDGTVYILQYIDGVYVVNITLNIAPTTYTIDAYASAQYFAYATDQSSLEVRAKEFLHIVIEFAPPTVVAGEFMEVRATLWSNRTDDTVSGIDIRFEISIIFANGTAIHYTDAGQTDTTNSEGIATYGFDIPEGQIDILSATASYIGNRERWSTETTETTGVEVSILALVMSFLTSDIGLMIILSIAVVGIVAAGYNKGVKPKKKAARLGLENQLQMFKDLETIQHFMAVYLDRGTCVFYHPFTDERIQPDLISGFIAAITSVYGEIKGDGVRGTLEEIQYHGLRLNSYSGQYVIGILILEGEMTPLLRERLQFFVELFENQYDQDLDGWTGLIDCFDPEWVVSTLNSAFNYAWHLPHRFGPTQKVTKLDAKILDYIGAVRDEWSEFYIKKLLTPLAEMLNKTEAEVLDRLLLLQDRGIIVPIGIQTILQRQGLALVNGSDEPLAEPPTTVDEPVEKLEFDEIKEVVEEEPETEVTPEPEPDADPMESFVQDVESLLVAKADDDKKEDDELDEFVKDLRAKIGEDEETED